MKYWTIFIIFLCGTLFSNENDFDEELKSNDGPLFISLGSYCEVAVKLREAKLRTAAFPFDWIRTLDHDHFITLFEDDFQLFLDEKYFIQRPNYPYIIENCYYQIEFQHEWPSENEPCDAARYRQLIERIRSKYEKRIARFRELGQHTGKVFFIRSAYNFFAEGDAYWEKPHHAIIEAKQAQSLRDALTQFFPLLDFTLVIVNFQEENSLPIEGIERVIEFKVRKSHQTLDYTKIFKRLVSK